ncbi:MAG TPA: pantoate--beta-alanine ligase [Candidatus Dormibacteraeota bacterium]|nr:pantoate--beta-alanine ligase [Candidatus Dormibacteraeota bacterium]
MAAERLAVITDVPDLRSTTEAWRCAGEQVGLVPTMGALHAGHLSLIARCREECDRTVVSIFVNPLQFGPGEDYERYPRRLEDDLAMLRAERVDAAFVPSVEAMYPPGATTRVRVRGIDEPLEGEHRPGHFEGVATVVLKLFNAARPHRAYFGQKDAQQAALVGRLARDLDTGVEVVVCPTVREPDGLALSSRNAYLRGEERIAAGCLFRALRAANQRYLLGERDPEGLRQAMLEVLQAEPLARVDYAEIVDEQTFRPPGRLAVLAVRIGETRLIDNHRLGEPLA